MNTWTLLALAVLVVLVVTLVWQKRRLNFKVEILQAIARFDKELEEAPGMLNDCDVLPNSPLWGEIEGFACQLRNIKNDQLTADRFEDWRALRSKIDDLSGQLDRVLSSQRVFAPQTG